jgi:flagellar FliL protein
MAEEKAEADALDDSGEVTEGGADKKKKGGGLAALLPNLLKFVAIGLGALIFIVTVTVITFQIMNSGGKSQTVVTDSSSPYIGKRPEYQYYDGIGPIRTRSKDATAYSISVTIGIGYDPSDKNAKTELIARRPELQDFTRSFFSSKYRADLTTENEARLKQEILEALNTRVLNAAKAKNIVFYQIDVNEL